MKIEKISLIVIGVAIALLGMPFLLGMIINIFSATHGMHRGYLYITGRAIAHCLRESNTFPKDGVPNDINHQGGQSNQWHVLFDVEQMLSQHGGIRSDDKIPKRYLSADIWTVIKNIPDDPPPNLIIVATRNVDPSSLRTRLTDDDMDKHIRFREKKDDLWILNQTAVFIRADGTATSIRAGPPTSRRKSTGTYQYIYRDQPFDLTTNLVNGLQVKYLTPDGEAIPTND